MRILLPLAASLLFSGCPPKTPCNFIAFSHPAAAHARCEYRRR